LDPELRIAAPTHATGAVEYVRLEDIAADITFRLRDPGDVSDLAAAIGRLGQLVPVELRPLPAAGEGSARWQVVAGFRRLEALRLLQCDRVLARPHEPLPDEDAWALALSQALLTEPLSMEELEALRGRLAAAGIAAWALDLIDDAQARAPVAAELRERLHELLRELDERARAEGEAVEETEPGEVEVTPEELGDELLGRFAALNQDLALAFDAWVDLPAEARRQILEQARYVAELYPFLERKTR
jgi:ParB-like chromosome segregation protein Spo0J